MSCSLVLSKINTRLPSFSYDLYFLILHYIISLLTHGQNYLSIEVFQESQQFFDQILQNTIH